MREPLQRLFEIHFPSQAGRWQRARRANSVGWQVGVAGRNARRENAALVYFACDMHAAAMQLDEFLNKGEADAGALITAPTRLFDLVEALEYARKLVGRNASTRIRDGDLDGVPGVAHGYCDGAFERELEGVGEQVEDDLLPHLPIDVDQSRERRAINDQRHPGAFNGRAKHASELGRERCEIHRFVYGFGAPSLDPGKVEQSVNQLEQALAVSACHIE